MSSAGPRPRVRPRPSPAARGGGVLAAAALLLASVAVTLPAQPTVVRPARTSATPAAARSTPTTVILVRHAEKEAIPSDDPPLSPAGEARSLALLDALRDAGVQAVVTTQLQRTRLTAAPLARELGLTPEVVPVSGDAATHARQVADYVTSRHAGQVVLVVGHSNTIPLIVTALGTGAADPIDDGSYDDLYVVTRPSEGAAHRLHVRYGSTTATPTPGPMTPPRR